MDTQLDALLTLPVLARGVSGCVNSAFLDISRHFTAHLFSPWIPSSARGKGGGPRRFTAIVLNVSRTESKGANHFSRVPERGWPLPLRLGAGHGSSVESGSRPGPEVESPGRGAGPGSAGVPQHAGSRPLSGGAVCRGGDDPRQEPQGWTRAVRWV